MAATAKPEVNRSQLIRDFVTKNPAMPISEVVTALGKEGVKVSKNLVYMVKMKMKAKKVKEKKAKEAAKETEAATPSSAKPRWRASARFERVASSAGDGRSAAPFTCHAPSCGTSPACAG